MMLYLICQKMFKFIKNVKINAAFFDFIVVVFFLIFNIFYFNTVEISNREPGIMNRIESRN